MSEAITLPVSVVERLTGILERIEARLGLAPTDGEALLTLADVARRLRKSERSVQRLVKAGRLQKVPGLGERTASFRPADVARFLLDERGAERGTQRL